MFTGGGYVYVRRITFVLGESEKLSYTVSRIKIFGGFIMENPLFINKCRRNKNPNIYRAPLPKPVENISEDSLIIENNTVYEIDLDCLRRRQKKSSIGAAGHRA